MIGPPTPLYRSENTFVSFITRCFLTPESNQLTAISLLLQIERQVHVNKQPLSIHEVRSSHKNILVIHREELEMEHRPYSVKSSGGSLGGENGVNKSGGNGRIDSKPSHSNKFERPTRLFICMCQCLPFGFGFACASFVTRMPCIKSEAKQRCYLTRPRGYGPRLHAQ